jgi:hypothetical protein
MNSEVLLKIPLKKNTSGTSTHNLVKSEPIELIMGKARLVFRI